MYTVLGYERKKGKFEDKSGKEIAYDNCKFYLLENESDEKSDLQGQRVLEEVGKYENFKDCLPEIGAVVELAYNKHGKLSRFFNV